MIDLPALVAVGVFGLLVYSVARLFFVVDVDDVEITRSLPALGVPSVYRAYHDRLFRTNRDRYKAGLTGAWVLDEQGRMVLVGEYKPKTEGQS